MKALHPRRPSRRPALNNLGLTAILAGLIACATAVRAAEPLRLEIDDVSVDNGSSPAIPQLTAGYLAEVRFEAKWSGRFRERTDIEIRIDDAPVHREVLEFRDRMGTFQTRFLRKLTLPADLSTGWHSLSVGITAPQSEIVSYVSGTRFYANAADDSSAPPDGRELDARRQEAFLGFAQAVADHAAKRTGLSLPPLEPLSNPAISGYDYRSSVSVGYGPSHTLLDAAKGGTTVSISGKLHLRSSTSYWRTHQVEMPPLASFDPAAGWSSRGESFLGSGVSPGYFTVTMSAQGQSTRQQQNFVRQSLSVIWYPDKSAGNYVHVSINRDTPTGKLTRDDAPRFYQAMREEAYGVMDGMVAAANATGYLTARWTPPGGTKPPTRPPPPESGGPPDGTADHPRDESGPTTPKAQLTQLGQQSAARAAAAIANAIPTDTGLSPAEVDLLTEAALTDQDPATVLAEFAAEEEALATSGDGDRLQLVQVVVEPQRPDPGEVVSVTLTVRNTATTGAPASFDVGLTNYHEENRDVATLKRRSLAPGDTARYTLRFNAPRAYNFGGYAYLEPLVFSGDVLPQEVVNLRINWDGSTMTDAEIAAELRERNPCPDDYGLPPDRLERLIALYRQSPNEALAAVEREAVAAQRARLEADYQARLNDPKFQQQVQLELDARANTQLLAAYGALLKVAQRLGASNRLDLVAILDDEVFVDSQNRLHGDLALARRRIMAAVQEKQAQEITAVDRYLLAGVGNKEGTTAAYQAAEPVMSPTLALNGLANEFTTEIGKGILDRIMVDYRALTEAYRDANTDVRDVQRYAANLRELIAEARGKLSGNDRKFFAGVLEDATRKLDKLDDLTRRATAFQTTAKRLLGGRRVVNGITNAISTVGELWAVYEVGERVRARTNGGEDMTQAILAEGGGWAAKKTVMACPIIAAADTVMSGVGHVVNLYDPNFFKSQGLDIDPTQFNASTLVDIGTGATLAGVTDGSAILARRLERLPPLTHEDRAVLEARLAAFEARLDTTTDPVLRERLLTARSNVRQTLRERR